MRCNTYELERVRAAEEVRRVQTAMIQREERKILPEAQRVQWVGSGRAPSEFSNYNDNEEDEEEENYRPWMNSSYRPEEDAMNYSDAW
jgi:hypothetical protein